MLELPSKGHTDQHTDDVARYVSRRDDRIRTRGLGPMKQTRSLLLGFVLASLWMLGAGSYAYPDVKEEFLEQRRLAQMAREHPPMIPALCSEVRGVETRDFVRENDTSDRCWVDLASFRRLYPEIASETDEGASALIRGLNGLPMEDGNGSLWGVVLQTVILVLGPPLLLLVLGLIFGTDASRLKTRTVAISMVLPRASA